MKNYFEYKDEKSVKFWEINLNGLSVTTTYGKIGTTGQVSEKTFESEEKAEKEYHKLIGEKTKKGYVTNDKVGNKVIIADEKNIQKILKSGLKLLEKIQDMNINSSSYSLKTEMCEAEFRDVLLLDSRNLAAMHGLSELFYEFFSEEATAEALDILKAALKIDPKNQITKDWIKQHKAQLKYINED